MRKHVFFMLLMALLVPWAARAQETVTIGTGTSTTSNGPFNSLWGYSFVEQVYTAAEINMAGNITAVRFQLGTSNTSVQTNNIVLYMKNVSRSSFSSTSDYEQVSTSDIVYSGQWTIPANYTGWVEIELDTPFEYDGVSNLMVAMHEYTSGYSTRYFNYSTATGTLVSFHSDSANPDPYNLGSYTGNSYTGNNRPNIQLDIMAGDISCYPVKNLTISNITSEGMTLSWIDTNNTGATYTVYAITSTDTTILQSGINDTSYEVTELAGNTIYRFGVQTDCGAGDLSSMRYVEGRTACSAIPIDSLPYNYGFEDATGTAATSTFDPCWGRYRLGTTTAYPYPTTNHHGDGSKGLSLYSTSAITSWTTLPLFEEELTSLMVSFYAYRSTTATYGHYAVGVMSDPSDIATFDTIAEGQVSANSTWELIEVPLSGYEGTGSYIAIMAPSGSATNYCYIDDVTVGYIPACVRPIGITVSDITPTSATVTINDPTENGSYMLWIGTDSVEVTGMTYELTDLQPASTYNVTVKSMCSDGTMTNAVYGAFATPCVAISEFPWMQDFDAITNINELNCWDRYTGLYNDTAAFSLASTTLGWLLHSAHGMEGSQHMKVNIYGTGCKYWLMTPTFEITSGIQLSFDYSLTTYNSDNPIDASVVDDRFIVFLVTSDTTFIPLAKWGNDSVRDDYSYENIPNTPTSFSFPLDDYDGQTVRFAFYGESTVSGDDNDFHIDNIYLGEATSCPKPTGVTVSSVSSDAATIVWSDPAETGSYVVTYAPEGSTEEPESVIVSDTTVDLAELLPSTTYTVSVMADCGGEQSAPRSITFTTLCAPVAEFPWSQNFDNISNVNDLSCWDRYSGLYADSGATVLTPTTSGWLLYSTYGMNGSQHMKVNIYGTTCKYWLVAPAMTVTTGLELSFDYSLTDYANDNPIENLNNVSDDRFAVLVTTDGGSTWTSLASWGSDATRDDFAYNTIPHTGSSVSLSLDQYDGETIRIAFYGESTVSGGDNDFHIDNIVVGSASCRRPNAVTFENITATTATVNWTENMEVGDYKVTWSSTPNNVDSAIVTGVTTYNLTGLTPNTDYTVSVSKLCDGVYTPAREAMLHTTCTGILHSELPWTENFDSLAHTGSSYGVDIPCWTVVNPYVSGTSHYPYVYNSSTYAHSGSYLLYMYCSSSSTNPIVVLPAFEDSLNTLLFSFYGRASSTTASLEVGVITNTSDASTFTPVSTITPSATGVHEEFDVTFEGYTTGNIALRWVSGTYYLDDFTVDQISGCMRPQNVSINNLTATSAEVVITDGSNAGSYRLWISDGTTTDSVDITATTYTLTNLTPNTDYTVAAASICNGVLTETRSVSFTTPCEAYNLPFEENFDSVASTSALACWNMYNGRFDDATGTATLTSGSGWSTNTYGMNGSKNIKANIYSTGCFKWIVTPQLNITANAALMFDYSLTDYGNSNPIESLTNVADDRFVVLITTNGGSTWTPLAKWGSDTVRDDYDYATIPNTPNAMEISLADYAGQTVRIAFYGESTVSGGDNDMHVDNVFVATASSCAFPQAVVLDTVTETTADITIEDPTNVGNYRIYWTGHGVTDSATVTTTTYSITGLTHGTSYVVSVVAICSDGTMTRAASTSFYTACGIITHADLPYEENFDSYATGTSGSFNPCWSRMNTYSTSYAYPYVSTTHHGATGNSLYFYSSSSQYNLAVMPQVDDVSDLMLSFYMYSTSTLSNVHFKVGVMTNPADTSTFVSMGDVTLSATSTWEYMEVYFGTYTGTGNYIAFMAENNGASVYIDDVVLEVAPACQRPTGVEVSNATETTAELAVIDPNNTNNYRVYISHSGVTDSIDITSSTATLTNLIGATNYSVSVVAICDDGSMTRAVSTTFATACALINLPYSQDFNAVAATTYSTAGLLPACWEGYTNGTSNVYYPHVVGSGSYYYSPDNSNSLCMTSGSGTTYGNLKVVALPAFVQPVNTMTMTFWMATESATNGTLYVGYVSDSNDFVGIDTIPASTATYHTNGGLTDTVDFSTVPDGNFRIAFAWYYNSTFYSVSIDNVEVTSTAAGCVAPTISNVTVASNDVTVNFTADGTVEAAIVEGATFTATSGTAVTGNTYTFTNLQPATEYTFGLRTLCEDGVASSWVTRTVTTDSAVCFVPTNVTVSATTFDGATITWTAGGEETAWEVRVYSTTFDQTYTANTNSLTVSGLNEGTFNVSVRALCSATNSSEWSEPIQFSTESCLAPTGVTVSGITANSATVSWPAVATSNGSYTMEYGFSGFSRGQGTTVEVTGTTYTITGLESEAEYDVYVASYCGENIVSPWSTVTSFTTIGGQETYTITVQSNNIAWGTVTGGGTYPAGTQVTLTATATSIGEFVEWQDGNTEAQRSIVVTGNATYTATFREKVGIDDVDGNAIALYPNPASTTVTIAGMELQSQIVIVDMNGREVYRANAADGSVKVDVSSLSKGAYFVRITSEKTNAIRKLVVK